jgi:hypothetical protein
MDRDARDRAALHETRQRERAAIRAAQERVEAIAALCERASDASEPSPVPERARLLILLLRHHPTLPAEFHDMYLHDRRTPIPHDLPRVRRDATIWHWLIERYEPLWQRVLHECWPLPDDDFSPVTHTYFSIPLALAYGLQTGEWTDAEQALLRMAAECAEHVQQSPSVQTEVFDRTIVRILQRLAHAHETRRGAKRDLLLQPNDPRLKRWLRDALWSSQPPHSAGYRPDHLTDIIIHRYEGATLEDAIAQLRDAWDHLPPSHEDLDPYPDYLLYHPLPSTIDYAEHFDMYTAWYAATRCPGGMNTERFKKAVCAGDISLRRYANHPPGIETLTKALAAARDWLDPVPASPPTFAAFLAKDRMRCWRHLFRLRRAHKAGGS